MMTKKIEGTFPEDSSTDSSTDDCISRDAAISAAKHIFESNSEMKAFCMMKMLNELPSAKPKADVDALINKIETEFSWSMYDDWGNSTYLHDELIDFIREWAESEERWN